MALASRVLLVALWTAFAKSATEPAKDEVASLREEFLAVQRELASQRALIERQRTELAGVQARRLQTTQASIQATFDELFGAADSAWLLLCGSLVMFMHAGFAMLEAGCCRAKNASNVLMKNMVNVCFGTLGWWAFGWAFAYGGPLVDGKLESGFIGTSQFFGTGFTKGGDSGRIDPLDGATTAPMLSWFFQWAFCTAGATIVSGGLAERVQSPAYAAYAFAMTSFIYPVVVAWTWGYGWLASLLDVGYMDFAGSGVVHLTGGVSALVGTFILGPREGRWERPEEFEAHNLPLVVFGTFALWFGWYGFNPGSTLSMHSKDTGALAAQVAMNTTIAAATGGISVFLIRYLLTKKYDVGGLCNGVLAGLVSITAGCGNVESGSAFFIGLMGAVVYQASSMLLVKLRIDDPVDASCVHGACGIWGLLAAALFDWGSGFGYFHGWGGWSCTEASPGVCNTDAAGGKAIAVNLLMAIVIMLWAGTLSGAFFMVLSKLNLLRIDEETEACGMDQKKHSPAKAYSLSVGAKIAWAYNSVTPTVVQARTGN